jgi:large subunit ribosomal protein L5
MNAEVAVQEKSKKENPMRKIRMEKVVLSCGAVGDDLEKSKKLLEFLSGMKPQVIASTKRIPTFSVRPGLEVGTRVTLRGEKAVELLRKLLGGVDNLLRKKQVAENGFSFGIREYIEIPGFEYQREIGIRGLNITVVFTRAGFRISRVKRKSGRLPKKQRISPEEIIKYMEDNFKTEFG